MTKTPLKAALAIAGLALAGQAMAQITFYGNENFSGPSFSTEHTVRNLERYGFNDRASSISVTSNRWEVCEGRDFGGRCVILRPGDYPSLRAMGLNDRISSVHEVSREQAFDDSRYAPAPVMVYNARPRDEERLYEANVVAVHAIVGPPEQRCWVERQQVTEQGNGAGGTIAGALIGGILGHQIGGGTGRDLATVGGAVAGAAVGNNLSRNGDRVVSENVQHCANLPDHMHPEYWDVTYTFRGLEHHAQMTAPPGNTVTVNAQGEPRVRG